MMLYPAMQELLDQIPSRYQLVNVVAARARQIASRAEVTKEVLEDKPVSIAICEIAEGKVLLDQETVTVLPEDTFGKQPEEASEELPDDRTESWSNEVLLPEELSEEQPEAISEEMIEEMPEEVSAPPEIAEPTEAE